MASFLAYVLGQLLDIQVFDRLRQLPQWWIAPTASTILGNLLDTFAFFSVAFWRSDNPFMAEHWVEIAVRDGLAKAQEVAAETMKPLMGGLGNLPL